MTKVEFLDLPAQYQTIKPEIDAAMTAVGAEMFTPHMRWLLTGVAKSA